MKKAFFFLLIFLIPHFAWTATIDSFSNMPPGSKILFPVGNEIKNVPTIVSAYDCDGNLVETAMSSCYGNIIGPVEYHKTSSSLRQGNQEFMASFAGIWTYIPICEIVISAPKDWSELSGYPPFASSWGSTVFSRTPRTVAPTIDAGDNIFLVSKDQNGTILYGTAAGKEYSSLKYRWLEDYRELSSWQKVGENGEAYLNLADVGCFSSGQHTLTLEVTNGESTTKDQMVLTINNSPPQVVASGAGIFQIGDPVVLSGEVSDYDGDWITYKWLVNGEIFSAEDAETISGGKPINIPEYTIWGLYIGTYTVSLVINDGINDPVYKDMTIEVIDTIAPTIAPSADTNILWPPNHKMADIVITTNASDNSGGNINLSVEVASNESENGAGDGNTESDWDIIEVDNISGIIYLQLRAERSVTSNERTYTVTITATDESNNSSSVDMEFIVPHDKGKK